MIWLLNPLWSLRQASWWLVALSCLHGIVVAQGVRLPMREREVVDNPLANVQWFGMATTMDKLNGKTVVVLSYLTNRIRANQYAPELFDSIKGAVADKPIVILAICSQSDRGRRRNRPTPLSCEAYMSKLDFKAPNILHGRDEHIVARFHIDQLLRDKERKLGGVPSLDPFRYGIINPDGELVDVGRAGDVVNLKDEEGEEYDEYELVSVLNSIEKPGDLKYVRKEMREVGKRLMWAYELGHLPSQAQIFTVRKSLRAGERRELDRVVEEMLDHEWTAIEKLRSGTTKEKILAYERATELAHKFKKAPHGIEAYHQSLDWLEEPAFKLEIDAKSAFERLQTIKHAEPEEYQSQLATFTEDFAGTYYGGLASKEIDGEGNDGS